MRFFRSHAIKQEGPHAAAATVCRRAREHAAATAILVRSMLQLLMSCSGTFCCGLLVFPHSKVLTPITSSRWPTMIRLWAVIFPLSEGANPLGVARGGGGTTWAPKVWDVEAHSQQDRLISKLSQIEHGAGYTHNPPKLPGKINMSANIIVNSVCNGGVG